MRNAQQLQNNSISILLLFSVSLLKMLHSLRSRRIGQKHAGNESLHLAESSRQVREMIKHKSRFAEERPRAVVHAAERLQQSSQCFASAVSPTCMNEHDYLLCLWPLLGESRLLGERESLLLLRRSLFLDLDLDLEGDREGDLLLLLSVLRRISSFMRKNSSFERGLSPGMSIPGSGMPGRNGGKGAAASPNIIPPPGGRSNPAKKYV